MMNRYTIRIVLCISILYVLRIQFICYILTT
jgi:hypothetical protein